MRLELKRPIIFFDLETTGINIARDRIIEIAILKIHADKNTESKQYLINPTIPIPNEASAIHGIYDKDVKDKPVFKAVAKEISRFIQGCDFAGYNSNKFDIPLLVEEFLRADIEFNIKNRKFIDVQTIFHKMEQRTLGAAYKFYCSKELLNAHSALADVHATYEVFTAQLERYEQLKNDIDFLHEFSSKTSNVDFAGRIVYNEKGEEVFNFGKHKGKKVTQLLKDEPSYYNWMMEGDFPLYTKKVLTEIKLREFNSKLPL
jgi:DNA polymerase-3 subunit epsilon